VRHPSRARRPLRVGAALGLVTLMSTSLAVARADQRPVTAAASVSFPIAVPVTTHARLAALAGTVGGGARRAEVVRSLTPPRGPSLAVASWARQQGFAVVSSSPWLVEVRGPAAELASLLGTTATTRTAHGKAYPVAAGRLQVPAALRGLVTTPVGLDERPAYRHKQSYGGGDVQVMHDLPVRGAAAGADVTVGTLNLSGWHPTDVAEFATGYGLRAPVVQNVVVGTGHVQATAAEDAAGDQVEVALDAEAIAGTAPSATQRMYFGGNTDADYVAILSAMADDAAAGLLQTASTSWGMCEPGLSGTEMAAEGAQIQRMVAAGATFFAASGDSGSHACDSPSNPDPELAVDWPAAEVDTVGVGGTSVTGTAASGYTATGWSGSGGGCDLNQTKPAYQTSGVCPVGRAVPDMAALADPNTGYAVYESADGWVLVGGTSLAAPISAAGLADYLSSQADKHGVGNVLATAYAHPEAFTDVSSGSNGDFTALAGYDAVTGLGVPDWRVLGAAIRNVTAAPAQAASSNPFFPAPPAWNSLTVPFGADYNGGQLTSMAVRADRDRTCTHASLPIGPDGVTLPSGTVDGAVAITLSGTDPSMGCRATTRTVLLDRKVPNAVPAATYTGTTYPRFTLSWGFTDPAPSSGSDGFTVKVTDLTTGVVRSDLAWTTTRSMALSAVTGHHYALQVISYDRAGNASPTRTLQLVSYDDKSASLSRHLSSGHYVSDWTRTLGSADYAGTHIDSARTGATATFTFTGKTLTAGVVKSRYGGYADVYVDGVKKARISLYASSTLYRQSVRLATFTTSGTHKVVIKVVGAHQSGSSGNHVYLDRLTVI
jgi:hypothetical protein